jgi:IMP dehydrogenase
VLQFIGGLVLEWDTRVQKTFLLYKKTGRFIRITASGINESHPHNVTIKSLQIIQDNFKTILY